jgi:cyclase
MKTPAAAATALLVVSAMVGAPTAQESQTPNIHTTRLTEGLFMLEGAGGNSIVEIGVDGVVLVDTGYGPMVDSLRAAVTDLSDKPVRTVVNTHWHLDHVDGNQTFAKSGARIIAHENVRLHMSSDQHLAVIDRDVPPSPAEALPKITFRERLNLHWDDHDISLLHLPAAHSDGDTVVIFRSANLIGTGDIFFNCGYPYIDITHGGTIDGLIAAVERILELSDDSTRIVPGHGPLATRSDLQTYREMLEAFRSVMAREMKTGKDLPTILETKPTAELDAKWGGVFFSPQQFAEMVFETLKKD